jgi:DNA-binding LacI/PurR family transcriptional regulator
MPGDGATSEKAKRGGRGSASVLSVARLAGVSPSTVSNVLNGRNDRMSTETRAQVLGAMEQLGYEPARSGRPAKASKLLLIGLVIPSVANPFWGSVAREVESVAMTFGYQVLVCNAERNPLRERKYAENLLQSGVRGLIFGSSGLSFDHLLQSVRHGLVVVAFDRRAQRADQVVSNSVGVDAEEGERIATEHLLRLGHRRIGFLSGPIRTVSRIDRLNGWKKAHAAFGLEPDIGLVWEGSLISSFGDTEGFELGRAGASQLLIRPDRPTAIVAVNDMYALGAYLGARDLGLRIPDDVSIVGFDDISIAEIAEPGLTTLRQPVRVLAQALVTMLIGRLEGTYRETTPHLTVTPELIERASTAAPPAEISYPRQAGAPAAP